MKLRFMFKETVKRNSVNIVDIKQV